MNKARREELAQRAIDRELTASDQTELQQLSATDPVFAQELAALREIDSNLASAGSRIREHLGKTLGPKVRQNVLQAMAARQRQRTPWWSFSNPWFSAGLATAACAALALAFFSPRAPAAERGAALLALAIAHHPTANARLGVMAPDTPAAKACLWIPETEWNALPPADQASLVAYVKAQISAIRREPDRYTGLAPTAPTYAAARANIAGLRDGEFMIVTLVQNASGAWVRSRIAAEG